MSQEQIKLSAIGTREYIVYVLRMAAEILERTKDAAPDNASSEGRGLDGSHKWDVTPYPPPDYTGGAVK